MSVAKHHAEWLSLVEASGPFLSVPVLKDAFPQELDAHDPDHYKELKQAFEEWLESVEDKKPGSLYKEWISYVLRNTLQFTDEVLREGQSIPPGLETRIAEHNETLKPDLVVVNPSGTPEAGKPRLLIQIYPSGTKLIKSSKGSKWAASLETRMMELLRGTNVPLGLITNGEQWMLVHAPIGETTSYVSWYSSIWFEEKITLRAFRSLLGLERFFGVKREEILEELFKASAENQQEVTVQLGYQVRQAVEVLVQEIDRIDNDQNRTLLEGVSEKRLYNAALTIMMRLVFLFSAEERELLLLGDPVYDQNYAVSTLSAILREEADQHGEEILERRFDAWSRLLAAFRMVYAGVSHDRLTLPPYDGKLFNPDQYPFLEGRDQGTSWRDTPSEPLPINNRAVLHLLEALQILQVRTSRGGTAEARRLSFRALDIEQIGHVYEGLLDHTAVRADEPVLGIVGPRDHEEEIPISVLEEQLEKGVDEFAAWLGKLTKRSKNAIKKAIENPKLDDISRLRTACETDGLLERVKPFAGLLRDDTMGYPVVITEGSVYVTQGSDRRSTGTHYTPRSLTEPVVKYTLEPLVYEGPAEGKPKEEWKLKSAKEILNLKVCDMAMGSGAFLVQACRYLSDRLLEGWQEAEGNSDSMIQITPEGEKATGKPEEQIIPKDQDERRVYAMRIIADRCLYGVDKDPMAVEMAKLSIWLITMAKGKPFTFLDHSFKHGDSLLGVDIEQLKTWSLDCTGKTVLDLFTRKEIDEAIALRSSLEGMVGDDIQTVEKKAYLHEQAEKKLENLRVAGDLILGPDFLEMNEDERKALRETLQAQYVTYKDPKLKDDFEDLKTRADSLLEGRPTFHWPLEFPEVFLEGDRGGFDAFVGNPPFMHGQKITGTYGTEYREYLVVNHANGKRGSADLVTYFFLRGCQLLRLKGVLGMLATNTISQGDTREVGLDQITSIGYEVIRAVPTLKWPGSANLEVAVVWIRQGSWQGVTSLDNTVVTGITPYLTIPGNVSGNPFGLEANNNISFQGSIVLGLGFTLTPNQAKALISKDKNNNRVLFPYLIGKDVNSRPDCSPSRWVINFFDWPLARNSSGCWKTSNENERQRLLKDGIVPRDYPFEVAADFPDCLSILEEKVKPERTRLKDNGSFALRYPLYSKWWIYAEKRPALYKKVSNLPRVLTLCIVTHHIGFVFQTPNIVFAHRLVVFPLKAWEDFALLQSNIHEPWARKYSSSLESRLNYSPTDCFETFPFPLDIGSLSTLGEKLYSTRTHLMASNNEGLTKTYNRLHKIDETSDGICELREIQTKLDQAVAGAYGWTDLDLGHGFHETKQGLRFTISEGARREVLDRLLQLNHERYEEEVKQGLHEKKAKKIRTSRKRSSRKNPDSPTLPGL